MSRFQDIPEEIVDVGAGMPLCAQRLGNPDHPPLVLVMGLGQQLIAWTDDFCGMLVDRGFHVVRFDNRDVGRSWHASNRPPTMGQLVTRRLAADQYDIADMARDTAGLIDALGISPAHVVGVSLGGMIAQMVAARHPERVRSLTSIMSTTGASRAGWVAPSTLRLMFSPPARDRETAGERAVRMFRHIGSRGFPADDEVVRLRAMRAFDRDPGLAAGTARQMAAVVKSGDRAHELRRITAPTLVIHGDHDPMVHPSGGRATADAIPGARLETIRGLGHDIPAAAYAIVIDLIAGHAERADEARAAADGAPAPPAA